MRRTLLPSWMRDQAEPWPAAAALPIVGGAHPLRRRYRMIMMRAAVTAAIAHMAIFTAFYIAENRRSVEPPAFRIHLVNPQNLPTPPPIRPDAKLPDLREIIQKAVPAIGIAKPVEDFRATESTIATQIEMTQSLPSEDLSDLLGNGRDSLVIVTPPVSDISGNPGPEEFVAYEEAPVLISLPPPVYPEMARQAEVEGTVTVRVLIGKDGKVGDARVTEGIPMLNDAALQAARRALFKPALQQHKPVAVWVEIPMAFTLH